MGNAFLEIERKYRAEEADWAPFIALCRSLSPKGELVVEGPDSYYSRGTTILRWRHSDDLSQLTIKERLSNRSSLVRTEYEVEIKDPSPRAILSFIRAAGFQKLFRIRKHCHIFWFEQNPGKEVCVVIYRVSMKGQAERYFIEIEAEKGIDEEISKRMVTAWARDLGLTPERRIDSSLYEIYSNRRSPVKLPQAS